LYKGVDTGERLIRLKPADADMKDLPSVINLAGSKATLRILKPDEVKELECVCVPESRGEHNRRIGTCITVHTNASYVTDC
jgi:hypothetical protein